MEESFDATATKDKLLQERSIYPKQLGTNPNYFGTLPDSPFQPVFPIIENTTYETLTCVGFNPDLDLLEATVQINLSSGYKTGLCKRGSTEFVRFWVDQGSGWRDVGVASFTAHDLPDVTDCTQRLTKPLTYAVTFPYSPTRDACSRPTIMNVRAVLSWETMPPAGDPPPGAPPWRPVWGNRLEHHAFVKPRPTSVIELVTELPHDLQWLKAHPPSTPIPFPDPPPDPTLAELAKLYAPSSRDAKGAGEEASPPVEAHRFGFGDIQAALEPSAASDVATTAKIAEWKGLGLDWMKALSFLESTTGNVEYEQVDCVGLDYNREWLVANFTVKRPTGYLGTPCRGGSREHVAFWIDYDDTCEWTYVGTASVKVHDVASIPPDGLHYWVGLRAPLGPHRRGCNKPKICRVRAVLSWRDLPSTTDPDTTPTWGNSLDTHVQVKPGRPESLDPDIDIIGGISVSQISTSGPAAPGYTIPTAVFAEWGGPADPHGPNRPCPFGGRLNIQADVPETFSREGRRYRLRVRNQATGLDQFVITPFLIASGHADPERRYPDPLTGYVDYVDPSRNVFNMLGWWETGFLGPGDRNALWAIRLEMARAGEDRFTPGPWHLIQLDNTAPDASIEIDAGLDCADFTLNPTSGVTIPGHFVARDPHFGRWALSTLPTSLTPPSPRRPAPDSSSGGSSPTASSPGDPWVLPMPHDQRPCGYVVQVEVWDRSIVGSMPGGHNYARDDTGFCLRGPVQ